MYKDVPNKIISTWKDQPHINEIENNFSSYEEFCSQIYNIDDPRCEGYYRYTSKLDDKKSDKNNGEIKEKLYGNQKRIDKNMVKTQNRYSLFG
jgi:hypothetical protein